jgi:hypothetical protein
VWSRRMLQGYVRRVTRESFCQVTHPHDGCHAATLQCESELDGVAPQRCKADWVLPGSLCKMTAPWSTFMSTGFRKYLSDLQRCEPTRSWDLLCLQRRGASRSVGLVALQVCVGGGLSQSIAVRAAPCVATEKGPTVLGASTRDSESRVFIGLACCDLFL